MIRVSCGGGSRSGDELGFSALRDWAVSQMRVRAADDCVSWEPPSGMDSSTPALPEPLARKQEIGVVPRRFLALPLTLCVLVSDPLHCAMDRGIGRGKKPLYTDRPGGASCE